MSGQTDEFHIRHFSEMAQLPSSLSELESPELQHDEAEHDEEVGKPKSSYSPSRKRQRSDTVYPRKRALMACQLCRGRKTKCDNARPACSFCVSVGAACVYRDDKQGYQRCVHQDGNHGLPVNTDEALIQQAWQLLNVLTSL
jgi:hypothetical protein